ncbi:MAG TPA: 4-hydroxyphenylpyruvate dioxygenase [Candidatus Krumholzibacteria bacterium]|nr:4-hydroxyphenylpyruvate dioxygenase [Candidatus Krumholzibacteria bacterium]HPD72141.1 4-hydroxyphenylpyruvate dioxygenase [Candidatus Krumholzibacteria bacterium]HRY40927.1 4-hydroxyphenylpyruvate dioxygenase [Candidatus Krumholzibacteria bacterium]
MLKPIAAHGRTATVPAVDLRRIHHVELWVGNARQAAYFYRKCFGFDQVAYLGPETGNHDRASYCLRQGEIFLVLTSPLSHLSPLNVWLSCHGDGVRDLAFEVGDATDAFAGAVARGAIPVAGPHDVEAADGAVRRAAVRTYGDTIHSFIERGDYEGFLPGYALDTVRGGNVGVHCIDHVVGNVDHDRMQYWCDFYAQVFDFSQFVSYDDKDICTDYTALRSKVMADRERNIKLPINEPAPGKLKSQIQEYLDFNLTAGVQHIALRTDDIIETISHLRANGAEFLDVPDSYYEAIWKRVGRIDQDPDRIRDLRILVDRDDNGYLLQLFTRPLQDRPTLFLEVIQRCGSDSFGKGNFQALFEAIEREQIRRGNV